MNPILSLIGVALALAACQSPPPRTPVEAATLAACRERVDQVYRQQNRVDLSRREERDTPFASTYNSGITSRGLSARFDRGQQIAACTGSAATGAGSAPGSAMDPTATETPGDVSTR